MRSTFFAVAASAFILVPTACDDPFGPRVWNEVPDTVTIYSASRSEHTGLTSALDLARGILVEIEEPGTTASWDFLLTDDAGALIFSPVGVLPGQQTARAAISVRDETSFDDIVRAPTDSVEYTRQPVQLEEGQFYILRSRRTGCGYSSGSYYAKMQVHRLDAVDGLAELIVIRNPYCDDRRLTPPESDD